IIEPNIKINDEGLDKRILTVRNDPINFPFRVIGIGQSNKGNPVVPEFWIGKEFRNGLEFHREMDKLDWRKGKPVVSFCCTYSMIIIHEKKWINISELSNNISGYINEDKKLYIAKLDLVNNKLKTYVKY